MADMLLSIVIPVYQIQKYLGTCLDSLLSQEYQNFELILVDDGSTDGSAEIMRAYAKKDRRVRIFFHAENCGVTKTRLHGAAEARGEYVGFVDGDDLVEPQMFQRLMENAGKYHADISHCGYQMVFPDRVDLYYNTGRLVEQSHEEGLRDLLTGRFIEPSLVNKIYRRTLFERLLQDGNMDLSIRNHEDLLMNYYLFLGAERSVYEDICPYHYMVNGDSAANKQLNEYQLLDPLRVARKLMRETRDNALLYPIAFERLMRLDISLATRSLGEDADLIRPNRKNARKELRSLFPAFWRQKQVGKKLKLMALVVVLFPGFYAFVHRVYARVTGVDKKFAING